MNKIELNHFLNYKYINKLQSNPSQTQMAFTLGKARYDKNDYAYELYQSDGTRHNKLLNLGKSSAFIYESDQTMLIPMEKTAGDKKAKKAQNTIYYRLDIASKKLEKAYSFPILVEIVEVLNDQTLLLSGFLSQAQYGLKDLEGDARKKELDGLKRAQNFEDIDEIPFYFNGTGFTAGKRNYLMIYDTKTEMIMPIHREDVSANSYRLDREHGRILYVGSKITSKKPLTHQIYTYYYEKQTHENLYINDDYSIQGVFVLNDEIIVRASDMKDYGINQNGSFYRLRNQKLEFLTSFDQGFGNSIGSDCRLLGSQSYFVSQGKLYFTATIDDHSELFSLDQMGVIERLYALNGSIDGIVMMNGECYLVALYRQKLQELYRLNLTTQSLTQLSRYNQKVLRGLYVAKPKVVIVKYPTHEVKGFVLLPKDYDPQKTYPAILDIHGGPKTVYGRVFYHEMQYWANEGYFVFFANPRGSDGKGNAFADIRGKYGTIDYDDLMAFTDKVLKKFGQIDPKRVFVTGGSYGGFMTNWMVGHTDRFKAAATQRSISNWISFFGTSDIGFYFAKDQTDGHPNVNTDKLWEQSPLKYAMQVKTPLLLIHSDKDYRCPIEQAMQFYGVLKDQGLNTKLVWFKEETHELSRSGKPQGRVKRLEEISAWFNQYR